MFHLTNSILAIHPWTAHSSDKLRSEVFPLQILDIGCGEGSLLRSLCEPSIDRYDPRTPLDVDITARPLYPTLLGGIDIDERSIRMAAERTLPRTFDPDASRFAPNGRPCWDELRLQLWHGGIETPNKDFLDRYQCFVSTEVCVPFCVLST